MARPIVEYFSDLHCPHAYLTRYRLRQLEDRYADEVRFRSRCLAIELDQERPTPKRILDNEAPLIASLEEELPYVPWPEAKTSQWPVTILPAFEAVKAAESIDPDAAWALDWRIREAFFADHACISTRWVLADLAEDVGLDRQAFLDAWDSGRFRSRVIGESEEGWYEEGFTHSPTIRLPDGTGHVNPGAHWTQMDPERNHRVTRFEPGREDALDHLASLIEQAIEVGEQA